MSLKHATYLACKWLKIPRSGCNTGERGTRSDCIPVASALVHPFVRRSYVETGGGYLDSLSTAQTVGGTPGQQTVQYNITIQATATSHRRRYRAVTAQHINRGALGLCVRSLSRSVSLPLRYTGRLSFHGAMPIPPPPPRSSARFPLVTPPLPSPRFVSVRSRSVSVPPHRATISDWLDH